MAAILTVSPPDNPKLGKEVELRVGRSLRPPRSEPGTLATYVSSCSSPQPHSERALPVTSMTTALYGSQPATQLGCPRKRLATVPGWKTGETGLLPHWAAAVKGRYQNPAIRGLGGARQLHCLSARCLYWITSCSGQSYQFFHNMGNTSTACQMSNYSKRNVRVFVMEKAEEIYAFITTQAAAADGADGADAADAADAADGADGADGEKSVAPEDKKFIFRKEFSFLRVLASQTQEVPWEQRFLSVFVEDDEDENVCSKQIIHNMALNAPITVFLYDV
ncbi:uncharacterized protein [Nothobranchius furzeri]|uniref:uncharacterized protein n=1 Tax=Nothobranchius furzeri TaxID=105023 RepID=UPI003904AAC6